MFIALHSEVKLIQIEYHKTFHYRVCLDWGGSAEV